jgi:nucleoid-associated protein YgaU
VPEASEAQPLEEEPDLADVSEEEPLTETAAAEASEEAAPEAVADGERQDASEAAVAEATPETQQLAETEVAEAATNGAEEEGAVAIEEEASPDIAEAEAAVQPVDEVETVTEPETEQDVASLQESEPEGTASPAPAGDALVFVEAVEIDGGTVFVAGYAEPGRFVRVYANEILLGEVRVSEAGRFLIEAEVDLPVGDYIIRADLLGSDGSVVARAAVPFEREPGETIAAIAPRTPVAQPRADEPEQVAEEDVRVETAETQAEDGERAPDIATAPIDEDGDVAEVVPGSETPGVTEPEEIEAAADGQAADELEEAATTAEGVAGEPVHAAQPDAASQAEEHREAAAEPALSPALERVDGAVIIRRGDNLWRISRRVYGQGIRYSTIYLANQEQIRNPDLIWPGQVFTVPAETVEGEAADLEALGEQAVDPSQVPGEIIR